LFYFKKIISYFDYYDNGEKKGNCGYLKLLIKGERISIEIRVRGIPQRESRLWEIEAIGEKEYSLGKFFVDKGTGYFSACFLTRPEKDGFSWSEIRCIKLLLDENHYCQTCFSMPKEKEKHGTAFAKEEVEVVQTEQEASQDAEAETEAVQEEAEVEMVQEEIEALWEEAETEAVQEEAETETAQEELYADKWEQLCSIYPMCHPFGEEDSYISIEPKDFVVLRKEYQNLVNNSFLLHSYYNYHHVILGRMKDGADEDYYIGIPGVFYERDKKVAVMFGFEGFAKALKKGEEESEKVACGDFGYYMRRVEI